MESPQIIPQNSPLYIATAARGHKAVIVRCVVAWQATSASVYGNDLAPVVLSRTGKLTASALEENDKLIHAYGATASEAQNELSRLLEKVNGS